MAATLAAMLATLFVPPSDGAGATPARGGSVGVIDLAATSVLSPRRLPDWLDQTAATQRLDTAVASAAGPELTNTGPGAPTACIEITQGSSILYSLNATDELIPASNMKLLTAIAALDRLGPSYRYTTVVTATAPPVGGTIDGNLYLIGAGDPLLRTTAYVASLDPPQPLYTSLDQLASQVRQAGVQVITGNVVGDEGRYDDERSVPTWKPIYQTEGDVGPLSALDVNDGFVYPRDADDPTSSPDSASPATEAASDFLALLQQDGVDVEGTAVTGAAPAGTSQITSIQSPPLSQEVDSMLLVSDDTAAELFAKELGYKTDGTGSTAGGTEVIRTDLTADGLPVSQLVNLDGSGLDRDDRASCNLLVDALQRIGPDSTIAAGLPVAGKSGTLAKRLVGTPAAGRLRAKTGTLDGVASLSGFLTPAANPTTMTSLSRPLVFSILVNGPPYQTGDAYIDAVAVAMASYPAVPPISTVSPLAGASS